MVYVILVFVWGISLTIFFKLEIDRAGTSEKSSLKESIARRTIGYYVPVAFGLFLLGLHFKQLPLGWQIFSGWYLVTWVIATCMMINRAQQLGRLSYDSGHYMLVMNLFFGLWFIPALVQLLGDVHHVEPTADRTDQPV